MQRHYEKIGSYEIYTPREGGGYMVYRPPAKARNGRKEIVKFPRHCKTLWGARRLACKLNADYERRRRAAQKDNWLEAQRA